MIVEDQIATEICDQVIHDGDFKNLTAKNRKTLLGEALHSDDGQSNWMDLSSKRGLMVRDQKNGSEQ